jgi:hypothetical protein
MIVDIYVSWDAIYASVETRGTYEVGEVVAYLRVDGDGLPSELVKLLLAHDIACHNYKRCKGSALAFPADHNSTRRRGAGLHSWARAEHCAVLSCLSSTEGLNRRHVERVVEGQGEKAKSCGEGDDIEPFVH